MFKLKTTQKCDHHYHHVYVKTISQTFIIVIFVMCTSQTTLQTIVIILCLWQNRKTTQ